MAKTLKRAGDRQEAGDWREWAKAGGDAHVLIAKDPGPLPKIRIESKEDADLALKAIASADNTLASIEEMMAETINEAKADAVEEGALPLKWKKLLEKELEKWAVKMRDGSDLFDQSRTVTLNFGKLFFHASSGAIRLVRSVEYVLGHLKAKKLTHCIRTIEEPDKEAIKALDDAVLKEIGCKREKPDYFHYEVFKPEVK
jgi:phage host-nuclease inhibitor protein Gam